jgi:hypothetical protein
MAAKDQITIPEDLSTLSDGDLAELHDNAVAAFQAMLPEDGSAPTDEALDALSVLAEGIEAVKGEVGTRDNAALSRSTKARELADKVLSAGETAAEVVEEDETPDEDDEAEVEVEPVEDEALVAAAAKRRRRGPININLGDLAAGRPEPKEDPVSDAEKDRKIALAAQGAAGFNVGERVSTADMAASINSRLSGFNATSYMHAAERGSRQSERFTIAKIPRVFDEKAVVNSEDPKAAMDFVADERNLPNGSLVASGGWCAPSETLYDLVDISEAADLISIPEMQINRGGIRHSLGPDYRAVYNNTGFCYTEAQDLAGDYNGAGGGSKPCTVVPCPDFTETRLGYCGVCISAGLLQQRGYPEAIEDYINKTLNAHAHRVSAAVINSMVAQSGTLIQFPSLQAGAVAPLLTAIDLQATHMRAVNRMERNASIEVVLPTWTDVLVRADLARRLGVDLLSVPEQRINAWFAERQVNPQYVVDWQDISTTAASGFVAAPTGVDFLMYPAGTFIKGSTDSITLENIYDSVLLGRNNYTALFTEDPYLVARRNHDARRVRVPVTPDGATHVGIDIKPDGTV